jgi:hypothetical protein
VQVKQQRAEMIETFGLVSTVVQGYQWLNVWHEQQTNPPHLPENAILVFKRFKEAYDSKNIRNLGLIISNSYRGDLYGVGSKQEFLQIQQHVFERLPWVIYPCLTINVYSIVENTQNTFSAIIDTHSIATVLGVPTFAYDSAPVRCQIKAEHGLWVITEMFVERRLT